MKSKLQWEGPFKKEQTLSEYFIAKTPLGEIQIRFCNVSNLSTQSLLPGNPGETNKVFNIGIIFEKFSENNLSFSENLLINCFTIVDQWYQQKYEQLKNIFNTNPVAESAQLIHQIFVNKYCNYAKENEGKLPKDIPGCVKMHEALDILEEIFPETKYKG